MTIEQTPGISDPEAFRSPFEVEFKDVDVAHTLLIIKGVGLHIEGMDCVGKTAAVNELEKITLIARRHRVLTIDNPYISTFRELQSRYAWNSEEVTRALLDAIKYDINNYHPTSGNFVQESTLITKGFAMRLVEGMSKITLSEYEELLAIHPKFHESVYMVVDDDVRKERFRSKIKSGAKITRNDMMIAEDLRRFKKIDDVMRSIVRIAFHGYVLDTSKMTPVEIANAINIFSNAKGVTNE